MTTLAALYTDEDISALVAILLRSRGLNITLCLKIDSWQDRYRATRVCHFKMLQPFHLNYPKANYQSAQKVPSNRVDFHLLAKEIVQLAAKLLRPSSPLAVLDKKYPIKYCSGLVIYLPQGGDGCPHIRLSRYPC